jgi:SAM-dependent methyltransferase
MDFAKLSRLAGGYVEARIIQTAVELRVFDQLAEHPLDVDRLAARLQTDRRATELLLNALAALQLLTKRQNMFSLTAIAETYLVTNSSRSLCDMILFDASLWHAWARLPASVRSGKPARSANMYQDDPRETEIFISAMDSLVRARGDAAILPTALDWRQVGTLLDVGSGPGTYPIALCRHYPSLRATIFDLPGTLEITGRYVSAAGLEERIRLVSGDYRTDPIEGSYDAVFLSNIIHGEGHEENQKLIGKLANNLNPAGRLIIKDHILDESGVDPPVGAVFALLMLLTTSSGRCFTFGEVKSWLEHAGLSTIDRIDLPPPFTSSLVIGTK